MSEQQPCYIEFRVTDPARFQVFTRFFDVLRSWTQQRHIDSNAMDDTQETRVVAIADETITRKRMDTIENWMLVLRPVDLELMGMPPHAESIRALQSWRGMTRRERREVLGRDSRLQILADFADMLKLFEDAEYDLTACRQTYPDRARIEYIVDQYPFEGKSALHELLLFFGFFSILDDSC